MALTATERKLEPQTWVGGTAGVSFEARVAHVLEARPTPMVLARSRCEPDGGLARIAGARYDHWGFPKDLQRASDRVCFAGRVLLTARALSVAAVAVLAAAA